MRIIVQHDDGQKFDITEGVQVVYDIATQSMDWSSGFLSTEEMYDVDHLAICCRFERPHIR